MSIMRLVPETGQERPAAQIAGRVRAFMAEHQLESRLVAQAIGMSQPAFSRRYTGELDWSIDQLAALAEAFGLPFTELVSIRSTSAEKQNSPGGGTTFLPTGELSSAPSGTRTPNPLIQSHLRLVDEDVPSGRGMNVVPIAVARSRTGQRPRHLSLARGGAA